MGGKCGEIGERGTPLNHAARNGHTAIVELFLFRGIDTEVERGFGWTPLEYFVCNGHGGCVRVLLEKGVDAKSEFTFPYLIGNECESITRLLLENGADPTSFRFIILQLGATLPSVLSLLLERCLDIEVTYSKSTQLHTAVIYGHAEAAQPPLEHGANVSPLNEDGRTPLHFAAGASEGFPHRSWASSEYYKITRLLLENRANASGADNPGKIAFNYAKGPAVAVQSYRPVESGIIEGQTCKISNIAVCGLVFMFRLGIDTFGCCYQYNNFHPLI